MCYMTIGFGETWRSCGISHNDVMGGFSKAVYLFVDVHIERHGDSSYYQMTFLGDTSVDSNI